MIAIKIEPLISSSTPYRHPLRADSSPPTPTRIHHGALLQFNFSRCSHSGEAWPYCIIRHRSVVHTDVVGIVLQRMAGRSMHTEIPQGPRSCALRYNSQRVPYYTPLSIRVRIADATLSHLLCVASSLNTMKPYCVYLTHFFIR